MEESDSNPDRELAIVLNDIQDEIIEREDTEEVNITELSRLDVLIGLVSDILLEEFELELSHATAEERVRTTIQTMMNEHAGSADGYDDPVSRFREEWPEVTESKSPSEFEIVIPLPITGRTNLLPGNIEFDGHTLRRIDPDTWRRFEQRARDEAATDTDGYPADLEVLLNKTELRDVRVSEYTFWKVDAEGIDADFLVQQAESLLNVFLGQLSFVANLGVQLTMDHSLNKIRMNTRTVFQAPPFYLIFRDSSFHRVHPGEYPVRKPIPRIRHNFYFEDIIGEFPSLATFESLSDSRYADDSTIDNRPAEAQLSASFRTFGQAMRGRDPEFVFLSLYRTLEHITFTKYAESKEPLNRALRLLNAENDSQVNDLVEVVKNRRNTIVHEGTDVQITQTDLNLLKSLSMGAIKRVGELSKSHKTDQIIAYLTTESISGEIAELEREIEETEEEVAWLKEVLKLENVPDL